MGQKHLLNSDFDALNEGASSESMSSTSEVVFPTFPPMKNKARPDSTFDESEPSISPRSAYEMTRKFSAADQDYEASEASFECINSRHKTDDVPLSLHIMSSNKSSTHGRESRKKSAFEELPDNSGSYYVTEDSVVARQKHYMCESRQKGYIGEDEEIVSDYTEVEMQEHIRHIATVGKRRKEGDKRSVYILIALG
jgi:hypothetical protein